MLIMRPEQPQQYPVIRRINLKAFAGSEEADLVEALRKTPAYVKGLGLVAQQEREVVGYLLFTRIEIVHGETRFPALAAAPLAVLPDWQNQGVGSQLMRYGLQKCEEMGHDLVLLLGHQRYYTRFGFEPASRYGVQFPIPLDDPDHFMAWSPNPARLEEVRGVVCYPPAFGI